MSAVLSADSLFAPLAEAQASLGGGPAWADYRRRALALLMERGLPTPRDDAWKYTDLRLISRRTLTPAGPKPLSLDLLHSIRGGSPLPEEAPLLVLIDGRPAPALSSSALPAGVSAWRLSELLQSTTPQALSAPYAEPGPGGEDRLRLLASALLEDGLVIRVAAGAAIAVPLHVLYVTTGTASYPRVSAALGEGSALTLLEEHLSLADDALVVPTFDARLEPDSELLHYRLQRGGPRLMLFPDERIELTEDARYAQQAFGLGAQLERTDLRVRLAGPGAQARLSGLFIADGTRQVHTRVVVEHAVGRTRSEQLYRGVAFGRGRGSYDGKVIVRAGAAGSVSSQSSRNLLLSPQAQIDVRPQLEIYNNDVQCSHGATTGAFDANMMFYLLSRGLDPATARGLLTYAFAGDVLRAVGLPGLRRLIEDHVLAALPDAALIREFV